MSTIVTRAGKGSPLENSELDLNFTNLNTDKLEINAALGTPASVTLTNATGLPTAGLVDNAVTNPKLRDSAGLSVIGRGANSTGDPADIVAGTNKQVLRRDGSSLGFGAVDLSSNQAVTGTLPVNQGGTGITSFGSGVATWLGTPSSANLAAAVTDETGTGALVFATSPTLVTPALGTPASGVVTNLTGTASININGTVGATTPAAGAFTTLNTSGAVVFNEAGANVDFRVEGDTNANLLFVDASADNVGIGTSVPDERLSISGNLSFSDTNSRILFRNDASRVVGVENEQSSPNSDLNIFARGIGGGWEGRIKFYTSSNSASLTERMRINSDGNVGIGTSAPTNKLDVSTDAVIRAGTGGTPSTGGALWLTTGASAGGVRSAGIRAVSTGVANSHDLVFLTNGDAVAPTERMRIDGAGNVGIGTTSPATLLHVFGTNNLSSIETRIEQNGTSNVGLRLKRNGSDIAYFGNGAFSISGGSSTDASLTAVNNLLFGAGGSTERMRLDSSGNLGLGATSPASLLEVQGGLTTTGAVVTLSSKETSTVANDVLGRVNFRAALDAAGGDAILTGASIVALAEGTFSSTSNATSLLFQTGSSEAATTKMTLDSNGDCIVGSGATNSIRLTSEKSNPTRGILANLTNTGSSGLTGSQLMFTQNTINNWVIGQPAATDAFVFWAGRNTATDGSERMRIDSSGNLLVGTTDAAQSDSNSVAVRNIDGSSGPNCLQVSHIDGTASGVQYGYFVYDGIAIGSIAQSGTTAVLYNTTSDYRLKTVIAPVDGAGERIDALRPVEYNWNDTGSRSRGFLAHEFQEVYANSVTGEKDAVDDSGKPVYQSMQASTSEVIADLVAEIQSLRARVAQLESKK